MTDSARETLAMIARCHRHQWPQNYGRPAVEEVYLPMGRIFGDAPPASAQELAPEVMGHPEARADYATWAPSAAIGGSG